MECTRPVLSLFSGVGGLDLGFARAGFTPRLAIDLDPAAVATYRRNHPHARVEQLSISDLTGEALLQLWQAASPEPPVGVLGAPPCQPFSVGNRNIRLDDVRRATPAQYARLLATVNQEYPIHFFVFENVTGLLTPLHRPDYERFWSLFEEAGFRLFEGVLEALHFGLPQRRARLLIVGLNAGLYPATNFQFPDPPLLAEQPRVRTVIADLPEPVLYRRGLSSSDIPFHPNHWTMFPYSPKFRDPNQRLNWHRGRSFRVLRWDAPSWTVAYGHREVHIHPEGHRRLSVFEAMRLQGFPDSYVLEGTLSDQFRLVGDAVPPPVAAALACAIQDCLLPGEQADNARNGETAAVP